MDIKKIPKATQSLISASAYINNFTRALEELVYNALDAECTSIAIRVSIQESFIQILDNGVGIKKDNFYLLGQKYATSKYIDVTTLKSAPDKYGYCGLSLASIIEISQEVLISSRFHESEETWLITYINGKKKDICIAPTRPSKGTTVEIRGFLYNLNIQRKSIDNVRELQKIKSSLEQLSLIHCNVSISLRDDYRNDIIFKIHKNRDIYQTLRSLFDINRDNIQELQVEKNSYKVKAYISNCNQIKPNQIIYLNGKFISKTEIHKKINNLFKKNLFKCEKNETFKNYKNDVPFYVILISCPFRDVNMTLNKQIEFKDWTEIDRMINKLIKFYSGESYLKETTKERHKIENARSEIKNKEILNNNSKQSNIQHGIKGKNIKRKNNNIQIDILAKYRKSKNNLVSFNSKGNGLENFRINTKKEFKKPSFKDIDGIKHKNKPSNKQTKRNRKLDTIIDKFKNPSDTLRKRCEKLSCDSLNILNLKKIQKLTNKIYCNEEAVIDNYFENKDNLPKTYDMVKVKTSHDLILPFNEFTKSPIIPEMREMQFPHSLPRVVSLHPNTHDSRKYNSKRRNLNHIITNSHQKQNNNCNISKDNLNSTNKFDKINNIDVNNVNTKQVYNINEIKYQKNEINNSYLHNNNFDKDSDNIRSDLGDKLSLIESDNDNDKCNAGDDNDKNKTYSVHSQDHLITYNYDMEEDEFLNNQIIVKNTDKNNEKSVIIGELTNKRQYLYEITNPLSYCEVVFKSNEVDNIDKDVNKETHFNYELSDEENIETCDTNLLKERRKDEEYVYEDNNLLLQDTDMNIVTQNNLFQNNNAFQLKKRHDFMPKGMSQIFKTIRKSNDLTYTRNDYYDDIVYNNFADDVVLNTEIFSPKLENIDFKTRKFDKNNLKFNASSLKEAKVFGQIDCKFIATQIKEISNTSLDFLVIFDQHAVDERIKLESNLSDYFDGNIWRGVPLDAITLKLDKNDLLYLYNQKSKFIQFGLEFEFQDDKILINSIPKAILGKNPRDEDVVLKAVRRLMSEEIDIIKSMSGNVNLYPKAIMDLVFSESCRYAIKFGDKLSKSDCILMLKRLSACKTPFQCAHGRPCMAVLIDLPRNIRNYEVNFDNIKKLRQMFVI